MQKRKSNLAKEYQGLDSNQVRKLSIDKAAGDCWWIRQFLSADYGRREYYANYRKNKRSAYIYETV